MASTARQQAWVQSRHPGRNPELESSTLSYPAFEPLTERHAFRRACSTEQLRRSSFSSTVFWNSCCRVVQSGLNRKSPDVWWHFAVGEWDSESVADGWDLQLHVRQRSERDTSDDDRGWDGDGLWLGSSESVDECVGKTFGDRGGDEADELRLRCF